MIIRQAGAGDLAAIVRMRRERLTWLSAIGSDQWSVGLGEDGFAQRVAASIDQGETWVATTDHGAPLATIAVDRWTNPGLWSEQELADAMIVHRMISTPDAAGQGVGAALLAHADTLAVAAGYRWLRLDAWTTNRELHRLYERYGFRHVRTVTGHRSYSAALFERQARLTVPSRVQRRVLGPQGWRDVAANPIPPDHHHIVTGAVVRRPQLLGDGDRLDVSPDTSWRLWWQDDSWRLVPAGYAGRNCPYPRNLDASAARMEWPGGPALSRDAEYLVQHAADCEVALTASS